MPRSFGGPLASRAVRALLLFSWVLSSACGGGGGGDGTPVIPTTPTPTGGFILSVLAPVTITAGQSGTATVVITRTNGFTGEVSVAAPSAPTGITATVTGSPTTLSGVSVTVAVASTVAAGSYAVPLRATATGIAEQSASIAVTVNAAQPVAFSLSVDPVEFELPAGNGWTANGIVSIVRNAGFTGAVNVSVTGLSGASGAVVAASPSAIAATETASNLMALTLEGAAPGVYTGTVRATATGFGEQTATVRVRVSAPSTGTVRWTFCNASRVPRFFAVRDGSGAWRHIVPAGPAAATTGNPTTFSFSLAQSTAGIAMVSLGEKTSASPLIQGFRWDVYYLTAQEVAEQAAAECVRWPDVTTRTATATVSGYQSFDAMVASASRYALVNTGTTGTASTTLTANNLKAGSFDLFVTRSSFTGGGTSPIVPQGVILRRALDPANGAVLSALNYGTEGFAPAVGTVTFGNTNGESFFTAQTFMTSNALNGLFSAVASYTQIARPWYGVPASRLQAGDLHQIVATTSTSAARRAVIAFADQVSTRTLDFGPALPTPSVAAGATATPWLIRATGTLPTEYHARASLYLRETIADPRAVMITASRGYLGGSGTYEVSIPDLSAATGFTFFWNVRRGTPVRWTVTGGEGDAGSVDETFCMLIGICPVKPVSGMVYKSAQATGSVVVP
ncbi:MAG TPA: hypothetical protein DGD08_06525 [Gemmatimonas aurantiaca]|uniref:Uncharacterized protein n=2 Tax=Gemmatimonas aurantiaca TaxID=173480 RepID=C1A769_GEMAT|nr:hypothetical protein [Gemmatimonas aurantiaca]BAH38079.1 hypothetical protein GAU_1037 [Gemmatimonas aurantiaca T-27]HCT56853.1 hypothetical protein [Gemmatimonas aurantiaca]